MNNQVDSNRHTKHQRGAALVEMAIVILVFLMLVFGVIEFARAIFEWSRLVEATRAGARYAIVNDPACDIYGTTEGDVCDGGPLDCDSTDPLERTRVVTVAGNCTIPGSYTIDDADCAIVESMRHMQPLIASSAGANVQISYTCSDAGYSELENNIPVITLSTSGVDFIFVVPSLLGVDATVTMPPFETTRTGEDLGTVN